MMKIYTPKEWLSLFGGSPSLVIDDRGYIYSADGYYKIISDSPIGKIDYEKGYIYDKHYTDLWPTPIAYMSNSDGVIKVREYGKSQFSDPILYIQGDKIYTPNEYLRIFGGNASGYIKRDTPSGGSASSYDSYSGGNSSGGSSSDGGAPAPGCASILGVGLLVGIIYLLSSEARVASMTVVLAILANVGAAIFFLWQSASGKMHFEWNGKRFAKGLATGIGVYVGATALFVLLGLTSNLGTGHAISDAGGDTMELAAMFIGLPFVFGGLFAPGPKSGSAKTSHSTASNYTRPQAKQAYSAPKPAPKPTPKPAFQPTPKPTPTPTPWPQSAGNKIVACPHCGAKARIPVGKGRIRLSCPNPACRKQYEIDS